MDNLINSTLAPQICKLLFESPPKSGVGQIWFFITNLWSQYWIGITTGLLLWVIFEIFTRNGRCHYNSQNGFSPLFNRFVGSGTYLLFQTGTIYLLVTFFSSGIYCTPWPYVIHLIIFMLTGFFLRVIKFWVY